MLIYYNQVGINYKLLNKFYLQLVNRYNIPHHLSIERGNNRVNSLKKKYRYEFPRFLLFRYWLF